MEQEQLNIIDSVPEVEENPFAMMFVKDNKRARMIAEHRNWLKTLKREFPSPSKPFRIGVYIRFFNQTKYDNYLDYHKQQFIDTISCCPRWKLVDFYVDEGSVAPNMESAPEWCRLLNDAMEGKVDLILTQKISNISKKMHEVTFCSRILAAQTPPIGIYFISEDLYTLASYYQDDLRDTIFLPDDEENLLEDKSQEGEPIDD